jgi:hypothetical protein
MTTRKRRVEFTIETSRRLIVNRDRVSTAAWCPDCGERVEMLLPEEAARLAGRSTRGIYRQVEAGKLHFVEVTDGLLLICGNSLTARRSSSR